MTRIRSNFFAVFNILGLLLLSACAGSAVDGPSGFLTSAPPGTAMATGRAEIPPLGFVGFCAKHLQDCLAGSSESVVQLTPVQRRQLETIQAEVNRAIIPRADPLHNWDDSAQGAGDCNKYALAKRRELIDLGWPRAALRLAAAMTETDEGHLVLVVRTSDGDLVLDNRARSVMDWTQLPYRWVSIQSRANPMSWVSITGGATVALGRSGPKEGA